MMHTPTHSVARSLVAIAATLAITSTASAQTFTNPTAITLPAGAPGTTSGPASVYPSVINVAGVASPIQYVQVNLLGLSHTFPSDLDILLVSPGGRNIIIMSDVGGANDLNGANLSFTFDAPVEPNLVTQLESGFYRAGNTGAGDTWPVPAPAGPYADTLNSLNGTNANGTWTLYIVDDAASDTGSLAGGWSITFNGPRVNQPAPTLLTYQGRLDNNGSPANGNYDIQYRLWTHPSSTLDADAAGTTQSALNQPVSDGLFTVQLQGLDDTEFDKALWIELATRPAGVGGYTTLAPRQPLTASPFAVTSKYAANASSVPYTGITGNPIITDVSNDLITTRRLAVGGNGTDLLNFNTHFQVNATAAAGSYGGMYVNGSDSGSWPFIGYATNNSFRAWTYFRGDEADWRLYYNGDRLYVESNGYVGIGVDNPANRLELPNIASADGRARANAWLTYSSEKFKTNITPIASALERLERLQGVTFDWKPQYGGQHDIGFIAQRVAEVLPEVVAFENGEPSAVDYSRITALAVEAVKELKAKQDAKVDSLEKENADLKARLERIEALLNNRE